MVLACFARAFYQTALVVELNDINFDESLWCSVHLKNKGSVLIGVAYCSPLIVTVKIIIIIHYLIYQFGTEGHKIVIPY